MKFNKSRVQQAIYMLISGIGDNPDRDGLKDTPRRVADMFEQILNGYDEEDDIQQLVKLFDEKAQDMVIVKDIPFWSWCEHHFMMMVGKLHIAYIPNGKVLGLSKLIRIARIYAKRLQVQERLTRQIADAIEKNVLNKGVAVCLQMEHYCMSVRGTRTPGTITITTRVTGLFKKDIKARNEFEQAIK